MVFADGAGAAQARNYVPRLFSWCLQPLAAFCQSCKTLNNFFRETSAAAIVWR